MLPHTPQNMTMDESTRVASHLACSVSVTKKPTLFDAKLLARIALDFR